MRQVTPHLFIGLVLTLVTAVSAYAQNSIANLSDGAISASIALVLDGVPKGSATVVIDGADIYVPTSKAAQIQKSPGRSRKTKVFDGVAYVSLASLAPEVTFEVGGDGVIRIETVTPPAPASELITASIPTVVNGVPKGSTTVVIDGQDIYLTLQAAETRKILQPTQSVKTFDGIKYVSLASLAPGTTFEIGADGMIRISVLPARKVARKPLPAAKPPAEELEAMTVPLFVNGVGKGNAIVLIGTSNVMMRQTDLKKAGLRAVGGKIMRIRNENYLSLRSLTPSVTYLLKEDISLWLQAVESLFAPTLIDLAPVNVTNPVTASAPSAYLNYHGSLDTHVFYAAGFESGMQAGRVFVFNTAMLSTFAPLVRGYSTVSYDDFDHAARYTVGDITGDSGALGGSRLLGGAHVASEFSYNPYQSRTPLPSILGTTLFPGVAEVYVNGNLVHRSDVGPGDIAVRNVPATSGFGQTRLVVRDVRGHEIVTGGDYFMYSRLLKPGLHEYGYTAGYARMNFGGDNFTYGSPAGFGKHRFGLLSWLSAGARAEGAHSLVSAGPEVNVKLPFATFDAATSFSSQAGQKGAALLANVGIPGRRVGAYLQYTRISPHYATVSLDAANERALHQVQANVGAQLTGRVGLAVRYAYRLMRDSGWNSTPTVAGTVRLSREVNLSVSASRSTTEDGTNNNAFAGVTVSLGDRISAGVSRSQWDTRGTNRIVASKGLPSGSGFGARTDNEVGDSFAARDVVSMNSLQYQWERGVYAVEHHHAGNENTGTARAAGSIVLIDRGIYFARPIHGSYALVKIPAAGSGLETTHNNQTVGTTSSGGTLLVTNLAPYTDQSFGVRMDQAPLDLMVENTRQTVRVPYGGGAVVAFEAKRVQFFSGKIRIEENGKTSIPEYGDFTVGNTRSPLGKEGEFYLESIAPGKHLGTIAFQGRQCKVAMTIPNTLETDFDLGVVICRGQPMVGKKPVSAGPLALH